MEDITAPLTKLFETKDIVLYERKEVTIFGPASFYYFADINRLIDLVGPFKSVLDATSYFEEVKREREALPNVIHVNFVYKKRMAGPPPGGYTPRWTICACQQHYDESLRMKCPNCGSPPVRLLR